MVTFNINIVNDDKSQNAMAIISSTQEKVPSPIDTETVENSLSRLPSPIDFEGTRNANSISSIPVPEAVEVIELASDDPPPSPENAMTARAVNPSAPPSPLDFKEETPKTTKSSTRSRAKKK